MPCEPPLASGLWFRVTRWMSGRRTAVSVRTRARELLILSYNDDWFIEAFWHPRDRGTNSANKQNPAGSSQARSLKQVGHRLMTGSAERRMRKIWLTRESGIG
jgi:hypothetical protein